MVHIKLSTIKMQLQQKMHYPEQPDPNGEYMSLDEAFDELLFSFAKWLELTRRGSLCYIYETQRRGWMTEKMADLFTDYCITGWRVV